ncbi:MAG: TAXI family TRAP transporter solute-binding subunit [Acuticoccus sp.]
MRTVYWSAIGLAVIVIVGSMWLLVDPAPPDRITIATGIEGGFYDKLGKRFAVALRREGVRVDLVETAGSEENLERLRSEEGIDVAFVQGGVGTPPPSDTRLRSLATLGIEPVFIFARRAEKLVELETIAGRRFAMGPEGSGTRDFMQILLRTTGLDNDFDPVDLSGDAAAKALLAGEIDAAAFVTSPDSPWIGTLAENPAIDLVAMPNSDALVRLIPFATSVFLPARVIDFPRGVPDRDTTILGVATILMVREQLHPAIKQLLLQVSTHVVRGDAVLGTLGKFPSSSLVEYPLDSEAERFFRYGPTPARLYMPFWAANLVERFWVLVIPLLTLLVPILRFGPSTLQWSIRRRIYRWYKDLRQLEQAALEAKSPEAVDRVLVRLQSVEEQVSDLRVPLAFRDDVYRLRTHIAFVRDELSQQAS